MNFKENESAQKLRGGYYTSEELATYITRWVMHGKPKKILEPSCGDGIFLQALNNLGLSSHAEFHGFELFDEEAHKAKARASNLKITNSILNEDFLGWAIPKLSNAETLFDAVLGNPPFVRYQYLPKEAQNRSEIIFKQLGLKFTKHTNAWVPFVLASLALLKPGGRLGMILPSEIIHVMHAQSLRTYLGRECSKLLLVDPEEIWFEDTLQGAVILFAEKKKNVADHSYGLGIQQVFGKSFMNQDPEAAFNSIERVNGDTVIGKWTHALLTHEEREAYSETCSRPDSYIFNDIAKVDVGIVTGANNFFLVPNDIVEEYDLQKYAYPMFGRSEHCPGLIYDEQQHQDNINKGSPTNFIWLKGHLHEFPSNVQKYIAYGESQSLHTRYKCSVRTPWYTVPSVRSTKIGMLKRCHDSPKLILNKIEAYTTDTAYRIALRDNLSAEKAVFCFGNALTALSAELEGRHYGGGVLELVPSEIEKLRIALPESLQSYNLKELDSQVRQNKASVIIESQTKLVLGSMGISNLTQAILFNAWQKMKNRRQRIGSAS